MLILKNENGQMAIFIALFFQVLFVFFAMAINVGLVVHDKINLQNSVDIAAYYGAAKQSEILNQIGHINYQMRQNYKLFVWRYRVLSTIGLDAHPYNYRNGVSSVLPEGDITGGANAVVPAVCNSHFYWQEYNDIDDGANFCRQLNVPIPNIKPVSGGSGFVGGYSNLVTLTEMANRQIIKLCSESGIMNFLFAGRILTHFRMDGLVRKQKITILANKLRDSTDLRGESIEEGVRKTFESNLTNSNMGGIQNFQYFNSMSAGQCAERAQWLPEIKINPVIMYVDFEGTRQQCRAEIVTNRAMGTGRPQYRGLDNMPRGLSTDASLAGIYNSSVTPLFEHWKGEPSESSGLHSSVGYEKNPWCMVYSGVKATTAVRKPFSPMGGTVVLEAHGFAKPFGGRIGPWYGKSWQAGAPNSQATNRSQMVDSLLPSRDISGGGASLNPQDDVANYSRYPGDALGLKSARAMTAMITAFESAVGMNPSDKNSPLAWGTYNHLGGRPSLEDSGDSLARRTNGKPAVQRSFEIGAVAPDWFDALYYSIEPNYFTNYFLPQTTNSGALFLPNQKIYDFGSVKDGFEGMNEQFNIMGQIEKANEVYNSEVEYIVRDWKQLLTSWHQSAAVDYSVDNNRFGRCEVPVTNEQYPTTGNCIQGGRTGYSIKNVSRDYLLSGDHKLGGASGGAGQILNPPTF